MSNAGWVAPPLCVQAEVQPPQLTPQDRIDAVRPFWETQPQDERVKLLSVELQALRERARQQTEAARAAAGACWFVCAAAWPVPPWQPVA